MSSLSETLMRLAVLARANRACHTRSLCSVTTSHHITHLRHGSGADIYLVGVTHGSTTSKKDVETLLKVVKPEVTIL